MTNNYSTWAVEQVWGSDRFYYEGDVAQGQVAFVVDSGVALLDDLNVNTEWSRSFISDEPNPHDLGSAHGTAVASLIGAKANGIGLTGVAPGSEIVSLKALTNAGWGTTSTVTEALAYARDVIVENDLFDSAVVNLSLGGFGGDRYPIIREMADMGIKIVVAAGNKSIDVDDYSPASYGDHENVYTVSASTEAGYYSTFTNYDTEDADGLDDVDFAAPGTQVPTYNTDGTISYRNGTSFAAPLVSGVLLMSEDIKEGETFTMTADQRKAGMVADPLAMFDPDTYKHSVIVPTPDPETIYIEVPGPTVEVPVATPIIRGDVNSPNELTGTKLEEVFIGGLKRDTIEAGAGNDVIIGLGGGDRIRGGKGDDLIDPGQGKSKVWGGDGVDSFILREGKGFVKIMDFAPGEDVLLVEGSGGELTTNQSGKWTVLELEGDIVAKVKGEYTPTDLF